MMKSSKNSQNAKIRLMKDLNRIEKEADDSIMASPNENDLYNWEAIIFGPENTPWEGGVFKLKLKFTDDYPTKPPTIIFKTKIFHPNVYVDGRICLDILDNNWSPAYDILSVLISLRSLLSDPNENSPANSQAAKLYKSEASQYHMKVKECVQKSIEESELEDDDELNNEKKNNDIIDENEDEDNLIPDILNTDNADNISEHTFHSNINTNIINNINGNNNTNNNDHILSNNNNINN